MAAHRLVSAASPSMKLRCKLCPMSMHCVALHCCAALPPTPPSAAPRAFHWLAKLLYHPLSPAEAEIQARPPRQRQAESLHQLPHRRNAAAAVVVQGLEREFSIVPVDSVCIVRHSCATWPTAELCGRVTTHSRSTRLVGVCSHRNAREGGSGSGASQYAEREGATRVQVQRVSSPAHITDNPGTSSKM